MVCVSCLSSCIWMDDDDGVGRKEKKEKTTIQPTTLVKCPVSTFHPEAA